MEAQGFLDLPKQKRPLVVPDFRANSILDVDFGQLKKLGVKHILIDVDMTLRNKFSSRLEEEVQKFITASIKKFHFESVSLASNNMLNLRNYSEPLNAKLFQPFFYRVWLIRKPSQRFYQRILTELKAKPEECVMIGDKVHGDVYGGNVAGMWTVLVKPKGRDYWFDLLLLTRFRERRLIDRFLKKYKRPTKKPSAP